MRVSELKDRPVIDPTTARKRGRVTDVLLDPTARQLVGVIIAPERGDSAEQKISASLIARIGVDAVMLRDETDQDTLEVDADRDGYLDYTSLVGLEVLDDGGNHVGHLNDARIDPDSLAITAYDLAETGWRHWLGRQSEIGPSEVTAWSRELMLINPRVPVTAVGQQPSEQDHESLGETPAAEEPGGTTLSPSPTRRKRAANRNVQADQQS